jgi:Condensation domain
MEASFDGLTDQEKRHALSKFLLARITGPDRPHPLAYSQESRWTLTMSSGDSGVENHTFAWKLGTAVDPEALRLAVHGLLRRHACLRSVFGTYDGRTVRYVLREFETPFEAHDRTAATRAEVSAELAREAARPFDLRAGPVLRVRLYQTSPGEQTLLITAHHILADFWSLGIALRTLAELYTKIHASLPVDGSSDEADYDAFVLWEARRVLGTPGLDALKHWKQQFGDGIDFVELPIDRPWPATRGFRDAEFRFTLGARVVDGLRRLGHDHDCTLFAVMLALFNLLIYSHTRQTSIAVISPVSVRSRLGFENLVGAFGNHLLLPARLDPSHSFAELLRQVRQSLVDAMVHRDFPAPLATRRVRVRGVPPGAVPFPLKFNMPKANMIQGDMAESESGPSRLKVALEALSAELEIVDRRVTGNSELNLGCFETRSGLLGTLQYNVELFDEETIARMVTRLAHLAEIIGETCDVSVRDLADDCLQISG